MWGGRYEKLPSYELKPLVQEYAYSVRATYCLGAHIYAQTRIHTVEMIHTLTHARKHLYAHTIEMHTHTFTRTHIYAHAHSRTHTFTHTHIYTHAQARARTSVHHCERSHCLGMPTLAGIKISGFTLFSQSGHLAIFLEPLT